MWSLTGSQHGFPAIFKIDLSNPLGGIVSIDTLLRGKNPSWAFGAPLVVNSAGALIVGVVVALLWKPRSTSLSLPRLQKQIGLTRVSRDAQQH